MQGTPGVLAGMIQNEKLWIEALKTRNNVAHAYNHDIALDIVRQTKEKYYRKTVLR